MITVNAQSVASILRQVAAIAAMVLACLQAVPLPVGVRAVLAGFGGIILAIEHYVADPSTGTPAPAAPAANPAVTGPIHNA